MKPITRKYLISTLVIFSIIHVTYSSDNETSIEGRRQARVSGRIVKLYSGAKPDPILCLSDGFQADPIDCSVFYRCLKASTGKYTVYRFQCGPGTVYDPDTEVCNHPRSTKRRECGGIHAVGLISSSEKYMENEINELQKVNQELPSPITTKFPIYNNHYAVSHKTSTDAITSQLDNSENSYITTSHPYITTANPYVTTSKPYSETTFVSTAHPWKITTNFQTSDIYISNQPSSRQDNHCTTDGFMGDNKDCRKFYRCVSNQRGGFIRYEFTCSELTVWDDDTQGCNHPWAVEHSRCGKSYDENSIGYLQQIKNNEVSPPRTSQQQTQISYGSKVTQTQTQISKGPVNQNQTQINYGDNLNQDKQEVKQNQTQISNGSAVSQTQTQINYGDKVAQTQLQVDHSVQSSQTQSQILDLDTSNPSIPFASIQEDRSKCTKNGFVGDSNDCKKFYRCISNGRGSFVRQDFVCSEGTLWDEQLEACNHAWAVKDCGAKVSNQNNLQTTTSVNNGTYTYYTSTLSTIKNDVSDVGYGNQNNFQDVGQTTSSTQTMIVTSLTTKSPKLLDTDCESSGFYGNVNDCAKFYRCVESSGGRFIKYEYKCGDGTLWDADIESCNHAWAVKCNISSSNKEIISTSTTERTTVNSIITTVSLIQTTTQKIFEINDYDTGYGSQQSQFTNSTTTHKPVNQEHECKSSGFIGDNNDCKKFYRCEEDGRGNYIRHEFTCGEGTAWDPKIQACNHAWAVETCGNNEMNNNTVLQITTSHPVSHTFDTDIDSSYTTHFNKNTGIPSQVTTSTETPHDMSNIAEDNECRVNGFIGNKNDCKVFYRCVENGKGHFTRYEFSCGEGTLWDPKIEACNHAWAVEECGENISLNENENNFILTTKTPINNDYTSNERIPETSTQYETTISSSSTKVTSTVSNGGNTCVANGFLGDNYDCKKFYRCVEDGKGNFLRYEFSCGEGTVWDTKIEACNHEWAVETCGNSVPTKHEETTSHSNTMKGDETNNTDPTSNPTSPTSKPSITADNKQCKTDGFMGDLNDCKKFYRCVNDGKGTYMRYEFSCGDGTVWDSDINACNHIYSVKSPCGESILPTTESSIANNTIENSYPEYSSISTTKNPPMSSNNTQCEKEGFIGDENDCKKFYRCTDNGEGSFNKYEFTCGVGTIWDQKILACNHASSDLHCNTVSAELSSEGTLSSTSTEISTAKTDTTQKTDTISNKDECSLDGFYANSEDCKKFYRCVSDGRDGFIKYDFTCGDGTIWVQEIQACDHNSDTSYCKTEVVSSTPSNSGHEQAQTSTTSPSIKTTEKSTPYTDSDEYNEVKPNKPTSINENACSDEGFYPDKNNCKQFYRCVSDSRGGYNKYEFVCSKDTAWDKHTQSCIHINEVEDCQITNQTGIETKPIEQDEQVSETNETSTTNPSTNETGEDSCQEAGYFGNSQDCSKFYRCVDNGSNGFTKYDFTCGDGTIWDQEITACNYPQDVTNPSCKYGGSEPTSTTSNNAESSEIITTRTTTTAAISSTSSDDSTTQTTTTEKSTVENSSTKPNDSNYTCTKAGFYADPYDCKKFYRCVDWDGDGKRFSIYHFDCGDGTIWDPELETCNHEDSVYPARNCNGTQSQNNKEPTTTEGSKQEETTQSSTITTQGESASAESTTQKTTTQSSTESSSSSEKPTTQQSSSSEQTTSTQQSSTEQSTTQQSTTEQSKTTSDQSTSQQSTSEASTTTEQTTSTSTEQTSGSTEQSTTSTEQSTSSTEQSTTSTEHSTTTTEQSTSTTEQSTTTTEQSTTSTEKNTTSTEQSASPTEQTTVYTSTTTTEDASSSVQSTTSESTTTSATEGTTKAEETTNQESTTEQSSEIPLSTTEQSSTTQEQTEASSTTESGQETTSSSNKDCPETDDDQYLYVCPTGFRRHPKYCNLFYQCTEDEDTHEVKVAVFNCPNNTIYDEKKIQCVEENKADKKCDGEIAQKRRFKRLDSNYKEPIIVSREKYSCPSTGHYPFEKNEECSPVLFKCEVTRSGKLRGLVYQCPEGYVYWSISRRCEPVNTMKGCKHSYSNWSRRNEIPTEIKNVARKK